jgi:hypothetical protein
MRRKEAALLTNRDESGEIRLSREELENGSFDEVAAVLADETMTRGRAIKLAGAALLAGSGMMALFQSPAEARKKRRRRRKKKVTAAPEQPKFEAQPGASDTKTVTITNHQDGTSVFLLPDTGSDNDFSFSVPGVTGPITEPIEIAPGAELPVTVTFAPDASASPGVQTGSLTLVDADVTGQPVLSGDPLKVVPLEGTVLPPPQ